MTQRLTVAPTTSIRAGVRRALRFGSGIIAVGLASAVPSPSLADPFPAIFPLVNLLPNSGGDGTTGFAINGIKEFDQSGAAVRAAGDVNGDGFGDLIIGAPGVDVGVRSEAGASYVLFGNPQGFPAAVELAALLPANGGDGSVGFVVNGIDAGGYAGYSVSGTGDVNGDGIDDLIISAYNASPRGRYRAGASYVIFGRNTSQSGDFPAVLPLAMLLPGNGGDGSAGFVIEGIDEADISGRSVSGAGDINGDGIDDLIVGAPFGDPNGQFMAGESYVVFGRDTAHAGNFPAVFSLSNLLPAAGGDGSTGFALYGIDPSDSCGSAVNAAGDVNGDGVDDLIISAVGADPGGRAYAGESYVVFGRNTALTGNFPAVFPLASLLPGGGGNGSAGFVLNGGDPSGFSGRSVSAAGDVNNDGIDDLIVGAPDAAPNGRRGAGETFVVYGRDTAHSGDFPAVFPLIQLLPGGGGDGSAGFVLNGITGVGFQQQDYSGWSVSAAGDVNGDGVDDILVGAPFANVNQRIYAGESYVVFGRDSAKVGNFPAAIQLASLLPGGGGDGSAGFVLTGTSAHGETGRSVSAAGDVNGDGIDDIVIGSPQGSPDERKGTGQSYVVFGRAALLLSNGNAIIGELGGEVP